MLRRHLVRGNFDGAPNSPPRGVLHADPNVTGWFKAAKIDVRVWKHHDRSSSQVHDDLLLSLDGHARPAFELAVIGLAPPCLRMRGVDMDRKPAPRVFFMKTEHSFLDARPH